MFAASKTATPAGGGTDPQFNYVTMLLHGDGTNGAQNNTFIDSSTNNFTITRNGNTTQGSFSPYGTLWSNYFDGTGDYLVTPANTAFTFGTGDFTIECWVNSKSTPSYGFVWSVSSQTPSLQRYATNNTVLYSIGGTVLIASSAAVFDGLWHHVAVVKLSGVTTLYVDGVSQGTTSDATSLTGDTFYVGSWPGAAGYELNGYVSNIRVVKGTALYTSNFTPSTTPLTAVSGTSLLTCQSNRFIDNSSNNFTITRYGDTSVQRFSPFSPSAAYSTATIGGSGYFDGSGDSLTAASNTNLNLGSGDFTVECWFYQLAAKVTSCISQNSVNSNGYAVGASATANKVWWYAGGTTKILSSATFNYNAWNHLAAVRSGGTTTLYLNGASVGSFSDSTNYSGTTTYIGSDEYAQDWNGYIAGVRIVKGTAVYTSAFTPPTAPPTAVTNTQLLCNMTNGAIFDNAMMNDLETVGNAQISTSVKKYGTGSLAFDGTGDYLVSNSATTDLYAFGSGNFTIECWVYMVSIYPDYFPIYDSRPASTNGYYPTLYAINDGSGVSATLNFYTNSADRITGGTINPNTWYHVAVCRSGTSTKLFLNGTQVGSTYTDSNAYLNGAARPVIATFGNIAGTYSANGYIDDLRITKGYARYTANFTPPTAAFPNN